MFAFMYTAIRNTHRKLSKKVRIPISRYILYPKCSMRELSAVHLNSKWCHIILSKLLVCINKYFYLITETHYVYFNSIHIIITPLSFWVEYFRLKVNIHWSKDQTHTQNCNENSNAKLCGGKKQLYQICLCAYALKRETNIYTTISDQSMACVRGGAVCFLDQWRLRGVF